MLFINLVKLTTQIQAAEGMGQQPNAENGPNWRALITTGLRNYIVDKLVQAIFTTSNPEILQDSRMLRLRTYAENVEREMFIISTSRTEYYHSLALKIYNIKKQLEEKRLKHRDEQAELELQRQMEILSISASISNAVESHMQAGPSGQQQTEQNQIMPDTTGEPQGSQQLQQQEQQQQQQQQPGPSGPPNI